MIDLKKKYRTSHGKEVRLYMTDGCDPYPIHGAYKTYAGWQAASWTPDGKNLVAQDQSYCDLVEIRPAKIDLMIAKLEDYIIRSAVNFGIETNPYVIVYKEVLAEARRIKAEGGDE